MIIAHYQKFIFIPIQKTGSTSIRESLAGRFNCVVASQDVNSMIYNHTSACRLKLYFEEQKYLNNTEHSWNWNEYFKFTFVRNPYARLVSQYNYFCRIGNNSQTVKDSNGDEFTYLDEFYNLCRDISKGSFNYFVQNNQDHFDVPYSWFCLDEFDFIGKTENMQADFEKVIDMMNLKSYNRKSLLRRGYSGTELTDIHIPHLNKSTKKHYSSYYDEESKKIADDFYGEDIERFNYKFK